MGHQIICPKCQRIIANNPIIDDAESGKGLDARIIVCECGEKINYWEISAQLREQRTFRRRFQKFVWNISHRRDKATVV